MSRIFLVVWFVAAGSPAAQTPAFTLEGRITLDKPATKVVVVLQDPKEKILKSPAPKRTTMGTTRSPG
jgi:hypothetical protein